MRTRLVKTAGISREFGLQEASAVDSAKPRGDEIVKCVRIVRGHNFITRLFYMGMALLFGWIAASRTSTEPVPAPPNLYNVSLVPIGQVACALNAVGQVAGITNYAAGSNSRPVVWNQDNPASTAIAPISQDEFCSVSGINDAGQIVGGFNTDVAFVPFVWSSSGVEQIPLPNGATSGQASGINQAGDIVGISTGGSDRRAFVWRTGSDAQELTPLPNDTFSSARGINDSGQVAGTSGTDSSRHAVLWSNTGVVQDLGTLPGDTASEATGINITGNVVGYSEGPGGTRAFLWNSANGMQDLGQLINSTDSQAFAINDSGAVVGTYKVSGESHAFIWNAQNGMQDLNLQISPASTPYLARVLGIPGIPGISGSSGDLPIVLIAAHAINKNGQIIATAIDVNPPCADASGVCPMGSDCAPLPKYFFVLAPQ